MIIINSKQDELRAEHAFANTREEIDKADGWTIIKRFKSKSLLAMYAANADEMADLEFKYPLRNYRRKLDLDKMYVAIKRK